MCFSNNNWKGVKPVCFKLPAIYESLPDVVTRFYVTNHSHKITCGFFCYSPPLCLHHALQFCDEVVLTFSFQVITYKLITPSVVSERLKVRASLAKAGLRELQAKGLVKCIVHHGGQIVYTRATKEADVIVE